MLDSIENLLVCNLHEVQPDCGLRRSDGYIQRRTACLTN
jgi:hypothetical protein